MKHLGGHGRADSLDGQLSVARIGARQHGGELLAPDPRDHVHFAKRAAQHVGHTAEHVVAGRVAVPVVEVFESVDVDWRGIGTVPKSGLRIRKEFEAFDAQKMFEFEVPESESPKGCACGEILTGTKIPPQCPLYDKACTPLDPVGPCMVSSEGTCAAYYRYHTNKSF